MMNSLAAWSGLGEALLGWCLRMNAWTLAVFAVVRVADLALARRARAAYRIVFYMAVAARVLLPLDVSTPLSVGAVERIPLPTILPPPVRALGGVPSAATWGLVVLSLYALGALLLLVRWARARRTLASALRDASPSTVQGATVLVHDILGPLVAGVLRPVIVVPRTVLGALSADAVALVVRHERAHVDRRDPLLLSAMQLFAIGAWPIAGVWLALARVRVLVELACDEVVLCAADRVAYGKALLSAAELSAGPVSSFAAVGIGGEVGGRIRALGLRRRWPLALQLMLPAVLTAVLVACATSGAGPMPNATAWTPPPEPVSTKVWSALCEKDPDRGPEQTAWCKQRGAMFEKTDPAFIEQSIDMEAVNALGQIGKDFAAAYAHDGKMCPAAKSLPAALPGQTHKYAPRGCKEEWHDGAGWDCMRFCMDQPMYFQYEVRSSETTGTFEAIARSERADGRVVTYTLRGAVHEGPSGKAAYVAPELERSVGGTGAGR